MGRCVHCGKNAGLLRSRHRKCQNAHTLGLDRIVDVTTRAVLQDTPAFTEVVKSIARRHFVPSDTMLERVLMGWAVAVDQCLDDESMISHEDELLLTTFAERHLSFNEFSLSPAYNRMVLGIINRDISESRQPSYQYELTRTIPLIFQDSETLIWIFEEVELFEELELWEKREIIPQHLEISHLIMTTHNIYFLGIINTKRIPYREILAVVPDGEFVRVTLEDGRLQVLGNLPSQLASVLILQLAQNGESLKSIEEIGFIGVNVTSQPALEGVLIEEVIPESPAATADLAVGDVIKILGDCPIRSVTDLSMFLAQRSPSEVVTFVAVREGEEMTGLLTLGNHPNEGKN